MDFLTAVKVCMEKYSIFSGRALRSEFWFFQLFVVLGSILMSVVDMVISDASFGDSGETYTAFFTVTLIPSFAAGARRLHDINRSGWWQWLWIIPIIGWIVIIVWLATKGEDSDNRFGPPPKPVTEG